jgi:hypothetical protein
MPTAIVNPNNKIVAGYAYPPTGKVKIYVESNLPVDVYFASNQQAEQIVSRESAANLGLFGYLRHNFVNNEIVTIPPNWKEGWKLVIGNNNPEQAAVFYAIWNA